MSSSFGDLWTTSYIQRTQSVVAPGVGGELPPEGRRSGDSGTRTDASFQWLKFENIFTPDVNLLMIFSRWVKWAMDRGERGRGRGNCRWAWKGEFTWTAQTWIKNINNLMSSKVSIGGSICGAGSDFLSSESSGAVVIVEQILKNILKKTTIAF